MPSEHDTIANADDQAAFEELAKSLREIEEYLVEQLREVEALNFAKRGAPSPPRV